jgi:hypothetical protein
VNSTDETNELLDEVDKLTKQWDQTFGPADTGDIYVNVKNEPLLKMLREAVGAGIGGGGSSLGSERVPINQAAYELYGQIEQGISELFVAATGKPIYMYPEQTLRQWYVAFMLEVSRGTVSDRRQSEMLHIVRGWANRILAMFNPPIERYLPEEVKVEIATPNGSVEVTQTMPKACPICGNRYKINDDGDRVYALVMQWFDRRPESLTGLCKACDKVWAGENALWDLRVAMDAAKAAEEAARVAGLGA